MKILVTGASGTVGSAVVREARGRSWDVVAWDHGQAGPARLDRVEAYVSEVTPDAVLHLAIASRSTGLPDEGWRVNREWPRLLARATAGRVPFLFTSTVMVYTDRQPGPYTPGMRPDASEGYGHEKLLAEEDVRRENPDAIVARLGWQIGDAPGSNNMVDFLERQQREHGRIEASERWYPACSFVADTAGVLLDLLAQRGATVLVDGNRSWSFYQIVRELNSLHGSRWQVVAGSSYQHDQRMQDPRVVVPGLDTRLPGLS